MMSEQDQKRMADYGIASTVKTVYQYKNYRYEKLADALACARIDARRRGALVEQETLAPSVVK